MPKVALKAWWRNIKSNKRELVYSEKTQYLNKLALSKVETND